MYGTINIKKNTIFSSIVTWTIRKEWTLKHIKSAIKRNETVCTTVKTLHFITFSFLSPSTFCTTTLTRHWATVQRNGWNETSKYQSRYSHKRIRMFKYQHVRVLFSIWELLSLRWNNAGNCCHFLKQSGFLLCTKLRITTSLPGGFNRYVSAIWLLPIKILRLLT